MKFIKFLLLCITFALVVVSVVTYGLVAIAALWTVGNIIWVTVLIMNWPRIAPRTSRPARAAQTERAA